MKALNADLHCHSLWSDGMLPPAEVLPTVGSVAEARERLARDKQVALAMVAEAGEENLEHKTLAAPWDPEHPAPLGQHLLSMVVHLQTHKAQLFYYLKLMGRDVNTMHFWGM